MIRQSERFLRDFLLEGALAEAKIIDCKALEPYIVRGHSFREEHMLPFLACIAAEVWARTCALSTTPTV